MGASAVDPPLERARQVLRAHRERLLADHAATAVGVGLDERQQPAIIVYLPAGRALPDHGEVEGVPVIFRTMGPVKPF